MKAIALALVSALAAGLQAPAPAPDAKGTRVILGRVLDVVSNTPIGGAVVTIGTANAEPLRRDPASRSVLTTPDGYFVVRDLAAGDYAVSADAFGRGIRVASQRHAPRDERSVGSRCARRAAMAVGTCRHCLLLRSLRSARLPWQARRVRLAAEVPASLTDSAWPRT